MDPVPTPPNAATVTANDEGLPRADKRSVLYAGIAFFLESGIQMWVRITGKRIREADAPWLHCPLGERGRIGRGIYERIAREENLQIQVPPGAGLIPDFNALRGPGFNPDAIHPAIRHFYEHAAAYQLEVWTEVALLGRFFLGCSWNSSAAAWTSSTFPSLLWKWPKACPAKSCSSSSPARAASHTLAGFAA